MAQLSNLVLILGSGPNVGLWVAKTFTERGYKIALAPRSAKGDDGFPSHQHFMVDLSKPDSVVSVFSEVKKSLGIPSVVVYNAGAATPNNEEDPLSLELSAFERDLAISTTSAFVAAKQAAAGFAELPSGASKTFIYTSNILNVTTIPALMDLGVGKSATAHMIRSAAAAYQDRGFKFYYADERKADGAAVYHDINGGAHGKFYAGLAGNTSQAPWQQTFAKGVGYKNFQNLKL